MDSQARAAAAASADLHVFLSFIPDTLSSPVAIVREQNVLFLNGSAILSYFSF
jgi:hypothetical protein